MAAEAPSYNIATLRRMVDAFGERLKVATVSELSEREVIFVEDGNHGENRPRQDEFAATGIAFLRPPDLKDGRVDFHSCSRINDAGFERVRKGIGRRGDIILTHRATVGRIAITDDDAPEVFVTNPGTTIWRSTDPNVLDQRFLYCFMRSAAFMDQLWSQVGNNSTFDYVSLTQQRGLRVAFPPLAEQQAIAAVLGALDDKIELNRRMNAMLEAMARALFQSWFVDFDPVRAKLDGREPAGLDPGIAALFPDSFQDSEAGHIPKGWTVRPLSSHACYMSRGFGPSYLEQGGVCVLNQKCVRDHRVDFSKSRRHDSVKKPINGRVLQIYDVLVNSTGMGTLGRVAQVFHLPEEAIVDSHVTIVRAAADTDAFFLGISLTDREAEIEELGEGSTGQTELSRARLGELKIIAPPFDLQKAFGVTVGPLLMRRSENETQSRTLATLRDTLLPKLLSGELKVMDTESIIGKVA